MRRQLRDLAQSERALTGTRPADSPTVGRVLFGLGAAVFAFAVVVLLDAAGLLAGPLAVVLTVLAWLALPASPRLSERIALTGAAAMGLIPVLWWLPWPGFAPGRLVLILGLSLAVIAFLLAVGAGQRRALLPIVGHNDWLPLGAGFFAAWYFLPLFRYSEGTSGISMLIQAFGGDNVAHSNIFAMLRRFGVTGPGWPVPGDGSTFAYVNYPQHFHALTATAAEAWRGSEIGPVETEIGLFGIATCLVLAVCLITLVAAVAAATPSFASALITAAAAVSFPFLGAGATSLSFGFPNFLLAVLAVAIAAILASKEGARSLRDLIAIGALVVLVAHSWAILTLLILVPFALVFADLVFRRPRPKRCVPAAIAVAAAAGSGVLWAAALVVRATVDAGTTAEVLAIPGAVARTQIPLTFALGIAIIGVGVAVLSRMGTRRRVSVLDRLPAAVPGLLALVAMLVAVVLIGVQVVQAGGLGYYQNKYVNGVTVIFVILLARAATRFFDDVDRVALLASRPPHASW